MTTKPAEMSTALLSLALGFIKYDPNQQTRSEIQKLLDAKDEKELSIRLQTRLQFGTAGLRGPMGGGYNRMNDLVILQTTQGLVKYLLKTVGESAKQTGVVIGYDHRSLGSLSSFNFARMSAAVFLRHGFHVFLLENFVPTPLVAYAVKALGCCCGIMVTASHNPKQDNGFKVYWGNGAQIVPPHDAGIAQSIEENLAPWQDEYDTDNVLSHPLTRDVTDEMARAYFAQIGRLVGDGSSSSSVAGSGDSSSSGGGDGGAAGGGGGGGVRIAYTAMHGVGKRWMQEAFRITAFDARDAFSVVASQAEPDAEFPTVTFPNPEEKGALDEAVRWANAHDCTLILANDPDADRLAVAERIKPATIGGGSGSSSASAEWRIFTGNEIGALLGHWQIRRWKERHERSACLPIALGYSAWCAPRPAVLASVVSSRMLRAIAAAENVAYYDTLTGFKWLGNKSSQLAAAGEPVLFAYEEALGYCVGDVVNDKDGISAGIVLADLANTLQRRGSCLVRQLADIYALYGRFVSYNSYVFCHDANLTDAIFARVRARFSQPGSRCCGAAIVSVKDVTLGTDTTSPTGQSDLPVTPESHMIMYEFDVGAAEPSPAADVVRISVTLRTSGTEPKIKFYTEIAGRPGGGGEEEELILRARLQAFVDPLVEEMLQPTLHGLARP